MKKTKTDLLIIGAGPGGYVAAIYAARKGLEVTLVDRKRIGGTCLNEGCIPTKALVRSAELYQEILHATDLGISCEDVDIDMAKIIDRKDEVKDQLVKGIDYLLNKYGVRIIHASARFIDDETVEIDTEEAEQIQAKAVIIATGSKNKHLKIPGIESSQVIDSEAILNHKELPKTLNVIGGGVIGMEFAFIYASLGVKVNVIEFLPHVLPGVDKEFSLRLKRFAKQLNMDIYNNAAVKRIETDDGSAKVYFDYKGKEEVLTSDLVLEAVGRAPEISGLDLFKTSIDHDEKKGVPVNDFMQTNLKHIYAIGDVNNRWQLAHVASHQALIAVDHILGHDHVMDENVVPAVIFTMPMIATIGKSEQQCKEEGLDVEIVKVPYSANGKALIMEAEAGYLKLIKRKDNDALIGAMIFGKDADQLLAIVTVAIKNKLSVEALQETIFAHPTMSEMVHEAALGLDHLAIHFVD